MNPKSANDTTATETPAPSVEAQADAVGDFFDELAVLVRKGGRVLGKLDKALKSAESFTGPMTRPMNVHAREPKP